MALREMRSYISALTRLGLDSAREAVEGATPHAAAISVMVTRRLDRRSGIATDPLLRRPDGKNIADMPFA
ncbi:hypothetical protein GCM10023147_19090 [Tsukamurella soli]|uniref:Uncharacterized protein n=1 Tax=Tsukamurella soli TaxID=644556 RepID=A0ABP8JHF0_9ACTN